MTYSFTNPSHTLGIAFPVYVHLGRHSIHPHFFFESLSYVVAFIVYLALRRRFADPIPIPLRWAAIAAAVAGAALGSKLLYWLEDPRLTFQNLHSPAFLVGGKTIVGALIGGLLTVELIKRYIGFRTSTGDLYAVPLALGIAIGRIGCFLTGLSDNTYGTPTNLHWAIDFGDGIPRHPTQLYELIFLLALVPILYRVLKGMSTPLPAILRDAVTQRGEAATPRSEVAQSQDLAGFFAKDNGWIGGRALTEAVQPTTTGQQPTTVFLPGDAFKLFMVSYMSFRLLADIIKPYPRLFLGLGGIQWACVLTLLYYSGDILRWLRSFT